MKKETKKLIAADILMALSCGAWGSVSAEGSGIISAGEHTGESFVWKNTNEPYAVDTDSVGGNRTISITAKTIDIESSSDKNQNVWVADAYNGKDLILGDSKTESITLKGDNSYKGLKGQVVGLMSNGQGSTVTVTAKDLDISVTGERAIAINVGNNTQYDGVTEQIPSDAAKMIINADRIHVSSNDTGLGIFSNGQLTMNGDVTIDAATDALGVRGFSTTNINADGAHKTVINGDINFGTPNEQGGDGHNSGNKIDATLNINFAGEGSQWTGRAYQEFGKTTSVELSDAPTYYGNATGLTLNFSDGAQWDVTGDSFANHVIAENGAVINMTEKVNKVNIDTMQLEKSTVNLQGADQNVKVNTYGGHGTISTNSLDNKLSIGTKEEDATLKVEGSGEIGDKILAGEATLEDLAGVVSGESGSVADTVGTDNGIIAGKMSAKVGANGKIDASTIKRAVQQHNQAVSSMANLSLMTWRQENNDMNKRLGEVRAS